MAFFNFPNYILKLKALTQRQSGSKVETKKVFLHMILYSYLCNTLSMFFFKIESN